MLDAANAHGRKWASHSMSLVIPTAMVQTVRTVKENGSMRGLHPPVSISVPVAGGDDIDGMRSNPMLHDDRWIAF